MNHLSPDTSREGGGLLLGDEIPGLGLELPVSYIKRATPFNYTQATATRLVPTPDTWLDLGAREDALRALDPEAPQLRRLGWYQSHPNISIFLSPCDLGLV